MWPSQLLLTTGRRRGVAADTVILVIDDGDVPLLSPTEEGRLPTMPAEPQADREFATLPQSVNDIAETTITEVGSELVMARPDVLQGLEARAKAVAASETTTADDTAASSHAA